MRGDAMEGGGGGQALYLPLPITTTPHIALAKAQLLTAEKRAIDHSIRGVTIRRKECGLADALGLLFRSCGAFAGTNAILVNNLPMGERVRAHVG